MFTEINICINKKDKQKLFSMHQNSMILKQIHSEY